jgi:nicotinate-nucleotide adenylyltransferase
LDALEAQVPGIKSSVVMIHASEVNISASEIRERVARGESIREFVPPRVADYIDEHHLYLESSNQ